MTQAFVLGAGLGTRLKKLTEDLPKPLVPVAHRPLIARVFDQLQQAGIREFIVNTHHRPEAYADAFPENDYNGCPVTFRHEPVLLETAGGLANAADLLRDEDFLIYNGDVLSNLPIEPLLAAHQAQNNLVTLALRSHGPALHIAWEPENGRVTDIRNRLFSGNEGSHQFTGVYVVHPEFLRWLTPGKKESVIPKFLEVIQKTGRLGGVVLDDGYWHDLGDRASYLAAHEELFRQSSERIYPTAHVHPEADVDEQSFIGPGSIVEKGVKLRQSILWSRARVLSGANLQGCIVRHGQTAGGSARETDF